MKLPLHERIKQIESEGYEVEIQHIRNRDEQHRISPRGGTTRARIIKDDHVIAFADAYCSEEENYNRRRGGNIALGRAYKKLQESSQLQLV